MACTRTMLPLHQREWNCEEWSLQNQYLFYQYAHAQSVKRLTADGFSIRFLAKLVFFFVCVTAVGSIASKKYTWLFPSGGGVTESLDSESDWCNLLDDPVEWKWGEACKEFSIWVAQIPTRISDLYVNSWQHRTGICYKHWPYWGIDVAEARDLHVMILVRSVGVVDSLKNISMFENRLQTVSCKSFALLFQRTERWETCCTFIKLQRSFNLDSLFDLTWMIEFSWRAQVRKISYCDFMFFLMQILQSERRIAEPCLQDGSSINKWQIVLMVDLIANNREVDLQDMLSCNHCWSSGVQ